MKEPAIPEHVMRQLAWGAMRERRANLFPEMVGALWEAYQIMLAVYDDNLPASAMESAIETLKELLPRAQKEIKE